MVGAASALFLLDIKGRVLVWRDYRGDFSVIQGERFFTKLIEKETQLAWDFTKGSGIHKGESVIGTLLAGSSRNAKSGPTNSRSSKPDSAAHLKMKGAGNALTSIDIAVASHIVIHRMMIEGGNILSQKQEEKEKREVAAESIQSIISAEAGTHIAELVVMIKKKSVVNRKGRNGNGGIELLKTNQIT